ncbi:MAG TPA: hypothetical protein DHN29_01580 [Cytophagales bacterium]|nr:hypothetical protein [Cytophagales bacterium]|tara:strand:+ start:2529 stop:2924 length:396 start_codon:yes stop_codon:yes gene_type:complete
MRHAIIFPSEGLHPKLSMLLEWVKDSYLLNKNLGIELTSVHRPWTGKDSGVHSTNPCRGIDCWLVRVDTREVLNDHTHQEFVDAINLNWKYDPSRPRFKVAMYHSVKGGAVHIHLQVHKNTEIQPPMGVNE